MKKFLSPLLLAMCVSACLLAAPVRTVTLAWDHSPTPQAELAGYNLYLNTDPVAIENMTVPTLSVGYVTTATIVLPSGNGPFYFICRAKGTSGLESDPSNMIFTKIPLPPASLRFAP